MVDASLMFEMFEVLLVYKHWFAYYEITGEIPKEEKEELLLIKARYSGYMGN